MGLSKFELNDDRGTIFSDVVTPKPTWGIEQSKFHFDFRDTRKDPYKAVTTKDEYLFFGEITYSKEYTYYSRSYTKMLDTVGNVYGMGEIVVFFVMFLYTFYNKLALNSYLCTRLLYLEEDESKDINGIKQKFSRAERFHS